MRGKRFPKIVLLFLFLVVTFFLFLRRGNYDGESRITLVLASSSGQVEVDSPLALFSIEPRKKRAIYLLIPGSTILHVPYGYQNYRASSIYALGELDKKKGGGKLLSKSIEQTIGVATNGYFIAKNKVVFPLLTDQKEQLLRVKTLWGILSWFSLLESVDTNLSSQDQLKLWWAIRGLRGDQITYVNMSKERLLTDVVLPDKSVIQKINTDQFELNYASEFEDARVRNENITLGVVNASNQALLATHFSRILEHLGATVVVLTSAEEKETRSCMVYLGKKEFERRQIVIFLKEFYKCQVEYAEFDLRASDVKIVLGEDFLK